MFFIVTYIFFPLKSLIAFEERKSKFDLWLSRVGYPVHGYRRKKPHSCKDTKMATPLDFAGACHGQ